MKLSHKPIESMLCAILRGEAITWPNGDGEEFESRFLALSSYNGVTPLIYDRLRENPTWAALPPRICHALQSEARYEAARELFRRGELKTLLTTLSAAKIPNLLLKGSPLAYTYYTSAHLRVRADTDILVRESDVPATLECLQSLDYSFSEPVSGISSALSGTKRSPVRQSIDLHWAISNLLVFARALSFEEIHSRSVPVSALGNTTRGPGNVDALMIASMHRASHLPDINWIDGTAHRHGNRLIWLYDIHLLAQSLTDQQWQEFVALTQKKNLSSVCLDAMNAAINCFSSPIPRAIRKLLERSQAHDPFPINRLRNRTHFFFADFKVLPTWRERVCLLKKRLFPPAAYLQAMYRDSSHVPLPVLYLRRAVRRTYELLATSWSRDHKQ